MIDERPALLVWRQAILDAVDTTHIHEALLRQALGPVADPLQTV